ncbi:hypothetical protein VTK26DRAFT_4864 [Humicola hyalothermophila]
MQGVNREARWTEVCKWQQRAVSVHKGDQAGGPLQRQNCTWREGTEDGVVGPPSHDSAIAVEVEWWRGAAGVTENGIRCRMRVVEAATRRRRGVRECEKRMGGSQGCAATILTSTTPRPGPQDGRSGFLWAFGSCNLSPISAAVAASSPVRSRCRVLVAVCGVQVSPPGQLLREMQSEPNVTRTPGASSGGLIDSIS